MSGATQRALLASGVSVMAMLAVPAAAQSAAGQPAGNSAVTVETATPQEAALPAEPVGGDIVVMLVAAVILSLIDAAWLMASSAFGFIRLASDHRLSKAAA